MLWMAAMLALGVTDEYPKTLGQWSIIKNDNNCAMMASFESGSQIWIGFDSGHNVTRVSVANPKFQAITDNAAYDLQVAFITNGVLDEGWGTVHARGMVLDSRTKAFIFSTQGSEILNDFAKGTTFGVWRGEVLVTSLALDGAAVAVSELRRCAAKTLKEHPIDPFAD